MFSPPSPLLALPQELLERIALHLALSNQTGPPVNLIPLLCTCKYVRHALSSNDLYAKIFQGMFDVDAPRRRLGPRALNSRFLASQLKIYCTALRRIRHGDIFAPDVEDVLRTVFILITENDGKNRAQLEWANTYGFAKTFVHRRLWHDPVNGWPRDTPLHALVLWVMWCMTDQSVPPFIAFHTSPHLSSSFLLDLSADILAHETSDERNDLITYILPYVVMAFKVSLFLPFNLFVALIFFSIFHTLLQTTTFIYPSQRSGNTVIFSPCRPLTVITPSPLLAGMPSRRCCTLVAPYAFARRPSLSPQSSSTFLVAR